MKITMENYSKLIDEVFKRLDWDHIMKYYDQNKEIEEEQTSTHKKGKRVRLNTKTLGTVQKELRDLVRFVVDSNFSELQHENWIIYWSCKESGYKLEIIFTPTRAIILEEDESEEEEMNSDEVERDVLKDMLKKSIQEENYELSAVIHSRLKKLDKSIKDKNYVHNKHK